jgi:phage gp29-like protein
VTYLYEQNEAYVNLSQKPKKSEPTERLMAIADRACDLILLGQTLTSEEGSSGSYALGNVHREVELDLYENYAAYVIDVINNQLIPSTLKQHQQALQVQREVTKLLERYATPTKQPIQLDA